MLLIADREGPIGLAGVMGGAGSEVSDATTDVVDRVGDLRPGEHPADRAAPRAAVRGEQPVREGPGAAHGAPRGRPDRPARARLGGRRDRARVASTRRPTSPDRRGSRSGRRGSTACSGTELSVDEQRDLLASGRDRDRAGRRGRAGHRRAASPSRWSSSTAPRRRLVGARARPGAGTSRSRRTSRRRSPASAATSWCRPSRRTPRCPPSVPRRSRCGSSSARSSPAPA